MKKAAVVLALLLSVALLGPAAAYGEPHQLSVQVVPPLDVSGPTPGCRGGTVAYHVSLEGAAGSGSNCLKAIVRRPCPPGVDARSCRKIRTAMTLRLPQGTIKGHAWIFEAFRCRDEHCTTVEDVHRWSGTVTQATNEFHDLRNASVSGGGTVAVVAETSELVSVDEALVINDGVPNLETAMVNTAPDTTITSGPGDTEETATTDTSPTFTFVSNAAASTFECSIDNDAFTACSSPFTTPPLAPGVHTLAVRAIDDLGAADPTPATQNFLIKSPPDPDPDHDHDGIPNSDDNCTRIPNPDQKDLDGDGVGDVCDLDDDGDGLCDVFNCADSLCGGGVLPPSAVVAAFLAIARRRARARPRV